MGAEGPDGGRSDARVRLIRIGLELLTERGFGATGIDEILRRAEAPKGSFYHHFRSKSEFALVLIGEYNNYFRGRITKSLLVNGKSAYARISSMIDDLCASMARYGYRRGCLIGNFTQELGSQHEAIRQRLEAVFREWETLLADCLAEGKSEGSIDGSLDPLDSASFFWIGWEGAIMRSKVAQNAVPLRRFGDTYLASIRGASAAPTSGSFDGKLA